ncbi:MAG TPA: four-carbon acid sugar kinase family protein [Mucilaginibacter sp.]
MIAVIADDLTGAAEIGGLGLRYDLNIEIICDNDLKSDADLLIISTDTRSMPEKEALVATQLLTAKLAEIKPGLVFKKVDSVLRGHVLGELAIHLKQLHLKKALLIPANPALGRIIKNGRYFINEQPIHLTSFACDPEFSITSPDIHDMLKADQDVVHIQKNDDELPESGIVVGECETEEEITKWIKRADSETLLAGGASLFKSLLESFNLRRQSAQISGPELTYPALFVCGSTFSKSQAAIAKIKDDGGPVSYMSSEILTSLQPSEKAFDSWANEIVTLLNENGKAVIAIHHSISANDTITATSLRNKKAMVVKKVLEKIAVKELLIEGGSTAAAIIRRLNLGRLVPLNQLAPGVIKLKANGKENLFLTLKPGSYDWPTGTWNF